MQEYLEPTPFIDSNTDAIRAAARDVSADSQDDMQKAIRLFYFVRDRIPYNIHVPRFQPDELRAGTTLARGEGFCIQKAVLLTALCRAEGIPARLGFAVIRNHRLPEKLLSRLKTNEIPDHGFAELYLNDQWIKATPAFDLATCQKNRFRPVEFDGVHQAVFHDRDLDGRPHIEYVRVRGRYADVPFDDITAWVLEALKPEAKDSFFAGEFLIKSPN